MPKVYAPLISITARGTFGNVLNYKGWGQEQCVRIQKKRKYRNLESTENQKFFREHFRDVVKTWQNLNSIEKLELDNKGKLKRQSGFNIYNYAKITEPEMEFGLARFGFSEFGDLTQ